MIEMRWERHYCNESDTCVVYVFDCYWEGFKRLDFETTRASGSGRIRF